MATVFLVSGVSAQEPSVERPITVRFTCYSVVAPMGPILFSPKDSGRPLPIEFFTSARSKIHDYTGQNPVIFFTETPASVVGEPPIRTPLAQAAVPEKVTQPLFIFFPNPAVGTDSGALPFLVYVFDDGPAGLPPRHLALINVSGLEFVGKINGQIMFVKSGLTPPMSVGRSAHVELRTQFGQRFYQSYASSHPMLGTERVLMILLPPLRKGSIEIEVRLLKGRPDDGKPKDE